MASERRELFGEQGYLVAPDVLSSGELEECRSEIDRLHRVAAELEASGDARRTDFQREPYAAGAAQNGLPVLRKIERTGRHSELFRRLAAHPGVLEVVTDLIGPDLLLFRSTLMLKPAFHGSQHGLHQDSAYWPMEPPTLVTVSIALNDATPENGCFQIIPQSHRWGLQEWGRIARAAGEAITDRGDVDLSGRVELPLTAGSVLFFHSLLVHGSGPNRSSSPRNTALYAYFPPTVRFVPRPNGPQEMTVPVVAGMGGREEVTLAAAA